MSRSSNYSRLADNVFNSMEKINSDLLAMMYGSLVTQLLKDLEDVNAVNHELDKLGFDSGVRIIEEFLATTHVSGCSDFEEVCEVIAKVGFKVFLGVEADLSKVDKSGSICYISCPVNPLYEYVELPATLEELNYSAFICGIIRGALEQLQIRVAVKVVQDVLRGADTTEYQIELIELMKDTFIETDDV